MKIENYSDMYFNSNVARKYSIMAAMVLNRILWSLTFHQDDPETYKFFFVEDQWWMKNTYKALATYFRGMISEPTIKTIVLKFEADGILKSRRMKSSTWNQEKWYTADPQLVKNLLCGGMTQNEDEIAKKPIIMHETKNVPSESVHGIGRDPIDGIGRDPIDGISATPSSSLKSLTMNQKNNHMPEPAPSSLSRVISQKKVKISTWDSTDPFSDIFNNLTKLSICKAKFETEDYRTWLTGLMEELSLTIQDLIRLSNEWQEHHNDKTKKPSAPKSSFRTWAQNNFNGKRLPNGTTNTSKQVVSNVEYKDADKFFDIP